MKIRELFEDVVDLNKVRQQRSAGRAVQTQAVPKDDDEYSFAQVDEREEQTVKELAEFEEWMHVAKTKGRIPGFDTMDDAIAYLLSDLDFPRKKTMSRIQALEWFKNLDEEERSEVRMIEHHSDRMIQMYEVLRNKLHAIQTMWHTRFAGKVHEEWDAVSSAAWLDSEFEFDITVLKDLKKVIAIVG